MANGQAALDTVPPTIEGAHPPHTAEGQASASVKAAEFRELWGAPRRGQLFEEVESTGKGLPPGHHRIFIMDQREIEVLGREYLSVPSRPKRAPRTQPETVVVGFDTEYIPARTLDGEREPLKLLSVQFSVQVDGGLFSVVLEPPDGGLLTVEWLTERLVWFLRGAGRVPGKVKCNGRLVRRVVLVSHYAAAELSVFADPLRDLVISQVSGKAHHARLPGMEEVAGSDDAGWEICIVDLYAFFRTSLAQIGAMVGRPKLEEDPETLEWLKQAHPDRFQAYAERDAEIAVLAYESFRADLLSRHGIDLVTRRSLAGVAVDVLLRKFMRDLPTPVADEQRQESRRLTSGWAKRGRGYPVFAGDVEVRLLACQAYSAGRVEAFSRGLIIGPVVERDVSSLYPSAALLQPLPNEHTRWSEIRRIEEVFAMEGVGRFKFSFPREQNYPSLPVTREGVSRLTFPRSGETACTFAEIRAAIELGADVTVIAARGFAPGERERDHDLGRFMKYHIELKSAAIKGTLEYEVHKLMMNAVIGKLGERVRGSYLLEVERHARLEGKPGLGALMTKIGRASLAKPVRAGRAWMPEHAALIVGNARSIMATITAKGAYLISTDAVVGRADIDYDDSSGVRALRRVGSELRFECEGMRSSSVAAGSMRSSNDRNTSVSPRGAPCSRRTRRGRLFALRVTEPSRPRRSSHPPCCVVFARDGMLSNYT